MFLTKSKVLAVIFALFAQDKRRYFTKLLSFTIFVSFTTDRRKKAGHLAHVLIAVYFFFISL